MKHNYFVFEGPDYCGKSSIMLNASGGLRLNSNFKLLLTREPGSEQNIICKKIREILQHIEINDEIVYSALFDIDRRIHLNEFVEPNIKEGNLILSDRSIISSLCYQYEKVDSLRNYNYEKFISLNPYTFFIQCPKEDIYKRCSYDTMTTFEKRIFSKRIDEIIKKYDDISKEFNGEIVINNNEREFEDVCSYIEHRIITLFYGEI